MHCSRTEPMFCGFFGATRITLTFDSDWHVAWALWDRVWSLIAVLIKLRGHFAPPYDVLDVLDLLDVDTGARP